MLRIHLTGRVTIESPAGLVRDTQFPGRQGLQAFVWLVLERHRPVPADRMIDALWADTPPIAVDTALAALLSKLRRLLRPLDDRVVEVMRRFGSVQLVLSGATWVDVEVAACAVDEAEGHWRRGAARPAWAAANVAVAIAREPLLPDVEAPWLDARRTTLRTTLTRALSCLADVTLANGEHALAVAYAEELIGYEPLREAGYRQLMRTHAALGNRADAVAVYHACRQRLRDDLGVAPGPETEALFQRVLTS